MSTISKDELFDAIERHLPVDTYWDQDGPLEGRVK